MITHSLNVIRNCTKQYQNTAENVQIGECLNWQSWIKVGVGPIISLSLVALYAMLNFLSLLTYASITTEIKCFN